MFKGFGGRIHIIACIFWSMLAHWLLGLTPAGWVILHRKRLWHVLSGVYSFKSKSSSYAAYESSPLARTGTGAFTMLPHR